MYNNQVKYVNLQEFIGGFKHHVASQVQYGPNADGPVNAIYDLFGQLMLPIVGFIDERVIGTRILEHTFGLEGKGISPLMRYLRDHTRGVVSGEIFDEVYGRLEPTPSAPARISTPPRHINREAKPKNIGYDDGRVRHPVSNFPDYS